MEMNNIEKTTTYSPLFPLIINEDDNNNLNTFESNLEPSLLSLNEKKNKIKKIKKERKEKKKEDEDEQKDEEENNNNGDDNDNNGDDNDDDDENNEEDDEVKPLEECEPPIYVSRLSRSGSISSLSGRRRSNSTGSVTNRRRSETAIEIANTLREESVKLLQRTREEVDDRIISIPLQEIKVVKTALIDTLVGRRKFHISWTLWVIGFSMFGAAFISLMSNISYVDAWFTAASAICNAGLGVVSTKEHPRGSFAIIAILMLLGGSSVMLLPTMIVRAYRLRKFRRQMKECLTTIQSSPSSWSFSELERIVDRNTYSSDLKNVLVIVADYYKLYDALVAAIWIVSIYTFLWIFFGALFLYYGLLLRPIEPELKQRGTTPVENAIFLSISSFTNSGLTISSNSLFYETNNDFVLFILSILILVGNTLMPVLLRYFISFILWLIQKVILSQNHTNITTTITSNAPFHSINTENLNNHNISSNSFSSSSSPTRNLHSNSNSNSSPNIFKNTIESISLRVRYIGVDWNRICDALEYILQNPRRICTLMFTQKDTKYLLQFAILCNLIEYFFFIITCLPRPAVESYGNYYKLLKLGLFQTLNTRHAGFAVFDLRTFPQDMLFVMALSMFLSAVPYVSLLGATGTHVPKEKAKIYEKNDLETHRRALLSKFSSDISPDLQTQENAEQTNSGLGFVVRRIVLRVWFLRFCVLMGLGRTEDKFISNHPEIINFWFIIFECISAFGLVGVSLGIPGKPYSLSGGYTKWGKILTILCFYMGKNRAMPKPEDDVIDFDFKMLHLALKVYNTSLKKYIQSGEPSNDNI